MIQERLKKMSNRIYAWLPEPTYTRVRNQKLFDWMNQNGPGKRVLNLGSGVGQFDHYLSKNIKTINLDISFSKKNLQVIADAHFLPFKSDCLDIVYRIAVLEHARRPWIVHVVVELPFFNVIHDGHDYFRFTDKGIRSLFDSNRFEVVFE